MASPDAPRSAQRAIATGERALAAGDLAAAEHEFSTALSQTDTGGDPTGVRLAAAANVGLGRICLARDDFPAADLRFGKVRGLRPDASAGFYWGGCAAAHLADYPRAEAMFGDALRRNAQLDDAYLQRAYVRFRQGQDDLALTDLLTAHRRRRLTGRARTLTGALLLRRRHYRQAESLLTDAAGPEATALLGFARHRQGRLQDAFADYSAAIEQGFRDDTVLLHRGAIAYGLGLFTTSVTDWTGLRERNPQDGRPAVLIATAHYARARQRIAQRDYAGAIEDLVAAGHDTPVSDLHLHAAARFLTTGDVGNARTHLARGGPTGMHHLALLDFRDGRVDDAEQRWRDMLDNVPGDPRARLGVAMCSLHRGTPVTMELQALTGDDIPQRVRIRATALQSVLAPRDPFDAMLHGLGGSRAAGLRRLRTAARHKPADGKLRHTFALLALHTLGSSTPRQAAQVDREACVGAWIALLHDEPFWQQWQRDAAARYRRTITPADLDALRLDLRELLESRLAADGSGHLLRRENDAARLLADLGGLPLRDPQAARLVCGPLWIKEAGLHREFGLFVNRLREPGPVIRHFSLLGLAVAQLAAGRPAEAAELAMELRCPTCRERAEPIARNGKPRVCEPGCRDFDRYNPALSAVADKHDALVAAGTQVAIAASLEAAKTEITEADMDSDAAELHWRRASDLAKQAGERRAVLRSVHDTALGRAEACERNQNWHGAVTVLETALHVIDAGETGLREDLTTKLTGALITRGVQTFNADRTKTAAAHADLQRAVTLGPHLLRARHNLALVLHAMAVDLIKAGDVREALHTLNGAIRQLEQGINTAAEGLRRTELLAERDRIRAERDRLVQGRRR